MPRQGISYKAAGGALESIGSSTSFATPAKAHSKQTGTLSRLSTIHPSLHFTEKQVAFSCPKGFINSDK